MSWYELYKFYNEEKKELFYQVQRAKMIINFFILMKESTSPHGECPSKIQCYRLLLLLAQQY